MSLSIFSFEKREVRPSHAMVATAWKESASGAAVLEDPGRGSQRMLLDLEHLTPEVLDKFFPSEATLAAAR